MILSKKQLNDIIQYTQSVYPREGCGIIAGTKGRAVKIYKMKNVSDKSEVCYFMDPKEQLKVFKEIRNSGWELLGVFHSHPGTDAYPSARDIEMAYYPEIVYVIVSLKNSHNPEVRGFKITDGKITEEELR